MYFIEFFYPQGYSEYNGYIAPQDVFLYLPRLFFHLDDYMLNSTLNMYSMHE